MIVRVILHAILEVIWFGSSAIDDFWNMSVDGELNQTEEEEEEETRTRLERVTHHIILKLISCVCRRINSEKHHLYGEVICIAHMYVPMRMLASI